jgi:alpha-tubulin suppressor-like RCC1 family protein
MGKARLALAAMLGSLGLGCPSPSRPPTPTPTPPGPTPTPTPGPTVADPALEIASRFHHTCTRRKSGTVLCWGRNPYGQLGGNARNDSARAVKANVTGVDELAVGRDFSCARRGETVVCWGNNEDGQLGDGRGGRPGALSLRPVAVAGLSHVRQIVAGEYHACALDTGGAVWCWGNAGNGQLGSDAQRAFTTPRRIGPLGRASAITTGTSHVCAVVDGSVWCWGRNTEGQLGDGKSGSRIKPVRVAGIEDAVALGSGHMNTCAIRSGGTVACWGDNAFGQLGSGARNDRKRNTPVPLAGLRDVVQIHGGEGHMCARLGSGRAMCWGVNDQGQAGASAKVSRVVPPSAVRGVGDAVDLGLGAAHACAARATGEIACWGAGEYGVTGPYRTI